MLRDLISSIGMVRVLDFLLEGWEIDFSVPELAEEIKASPHTVRLHLHRLEELHVVNKARRVGKTQMYNINPDSKILKHLKSADVICSGIDSEMEELIQGQL